MENVQVAGLLRVDSSRLDGIAIDQCGAVEGSKEPLVGINNKAVGVAKSSKLVAHGRREYGGATVRTVDVKPEFVFTRVRT